MTVRNHTTPFRAPRKIHIPNEDSPVYRRILALENPEEIRRIHHYASAFDYIPRYFYDRELKGHRLSSIKQEAKIGDTTFSVAIEPAIFRAKDGTNTDYFPGPVEDAVEQGLKNLALSLQTARVAGETLILEFTLGDLIDAMEAPHSPESVLHALGVLVRCGIRVNADTAERQNGSFNFYIESMGWDNVGGSPTDRRNEYSVSLHAMVFWDLCRDVHRHLGITG